MKTSIKQFELKDCSYSHYSDTSGRAEWASVRNSNFGLQTLQENEMKGSEIESFE